MPERMVSQPGAAAWMRARHADGATLCSVCAGAFVLAETGLMDGRRATTRWAFAHQLASRFPKVHLAEDHMVLDEGDIITAGGILAWTDLGLTLVERLLGPATMLATARFLLVEPPRSTQRPSRNSSRASTMATTPSAARSITFTRIRLRLCACPTCKPSPE
jgi:transcriptional regulator GlxA family with amidase domain